MHNVGNNNYVNLEKPGVELGKVGKAQITEEGHIRLDNGKTYSVKFNRGGDVLPSEMTIDQRKHLASKVLEILKESGVQLDSLDKLSIQSNKITHFNAQGEKQEVIGNATDKWTLNAKNTATFVSNWIKSNSNNDKNSIDNKPTLPKALEERKITGNLVPLSMQLSPSKNNNFIQIRSNSKKNEPETLYKKEVNHLQQAKRVEISKAISSSNVPPKVLAEEIVNMLGQSANIKNFKDIHQSKIDKLQNGWAAAKKEMGAEMDQAAIDPDKGKLNYEKPTSYSDFRDEANRFIHGIVNEAAKKLGIGETITKVFGTSGYNSDKDITLNSIDPKKPLTTEDMVLLKSIADMVTVNLMGVLPGTALDTEWYVELKFMGKEVEGAQQKSELVTLDMAMALVQAKEGLKNDLAEWEKFKTRDLQQTKGAVGEIKKSLYENVEKFYTTLENDIYKEIVFQHRCEKGGDRGLIRQQINDLSFKELSAQVESIKKEEGFDKRYYDAKVLSQYPKLMELGKECGRLEKEIANLKKQSPGNQEEIDKLIVQHDILYALINSRQPEGTMASSELATTLFSSLGQKAAREKEVASQAHSEILKAPTKNLKGLLLGAHRMAKIEEKRDKGSAYEISQLILAGQERLGQFIHVISHDNYDPKSAISAGKYCLRVAESNYFALKDVAESYKKEGNNLSKGLNKLLTRAEQKYIQAKNLEQCKRHFSLNAKATVELLKFHFDSLGYTKKLDDAVLTKLNEFEMEFSTESITKTEKLSLLCKALAKEGYLSKEKGTVIKNGNDEYLFPNEDKKLRNILYAYAGYDKKELQERVGSGDIVQVMNSIEVLHEQGDGVVKLAYNLTDNIGVEKFARGVESFSREVQNFMFENKKIPQLSDSLQIFNKWSENKV